MNTLLKTGIGSTLATLAVAALSASASANTITFGNLNTGLNAFTGSQTEDGFTYTVTSGVNFVFLNITGNPPSSLGVGYGTVENLTPVTGGQIEFVRTGGGLFTFDSFDLATNVSGLSNAVSWTGQVNGVDTQSLTGVSSSSATFSTQTVSFSAPIDKLILTFTNLNQTALILDNLNFTPTQQPPASTPEPGTILGLLAVGALGVLSRKRKA